ncbi:hypothetical protein RJ641_019356 [Dillenia turbinata]|uniref:Uncharacterized protein n=1 Tax=Dillenia turbinata TaxID=194707 RepID=A0AAN8UJC7_9MAGN
MKRLVVVMLEMMLLTRMVVNAKDTNPVYDPCSDAKVQRWDGFSFGIAFSSKESFFKDQIQLSPCDGRLPLAGSSNAALAVFRPKVDQLSLLSIDAKTFDPSMNGGYMVAFAGRKYAARSPPAIVADKTHIITSFTLVLEFQKGTLQNLYWKKFGCDECPSKSAVCLDNQDCAIPTSRCKGNGGQEDCKLSIQVAFSGTDKNDAVLNSWYEVKNLRQYSLTGLFSHLHDSILGQ